MYHHAWPNFVVLVEMGFYCIGQAGLELLTSGDSPASASQSAGITGMSHFDQPFFFPPLLRWDLTVLPRLASNSLTLSDPLSWPPKMVD